MSKIPFVGCDKCETEVRRIVTDDEKKRFWDEPRFMPMTDEIMNLLPPYSRCEECGTLLIDRGAESCLPVVKGIQQVSYKLTEPIRLEPGDFICAMDISSTKTWSTTTIYTFTCKGDAGYSPEEVARLDGIALEWGAERCLEL